MAQTSKQQSKATQHTKDTKSSIKNMSLSAQGFQKALQRASKASKQARKNRPKLKNTKKGSA